MSNLRDYLYITEAAEFLGVSASTLRNWERRGMIVTHRNPINRYRLYKKFDLEALLDRIRRSATTSDLTPTVMKNSVESTEEGAT